MHISVLLQLPLLGARMDNPAWEELIPGWARVSNLWETGRVDEWVSVSTIRLICSTNMMSIRGEGGCPWLASPMGSRLGGLWGDPRSPEASRSVLRKLEFIGKELRTRGEVHAVGILKGGG
jgi:hypothetical protein